MLWYTWHASAFDAWMYALVCFAMASCLNCEVGTNKRDSCSGAISIDRTETPALWSVKPNNSNILIAGSATRQRRRMSDMLYGGVTASMLWYALRTGTSSIFTKSSSLPHALPRIAFARLINCKLARHAGIGSGRFQ